MGFQSTLYMAGLGIKKKENKTHTHLSIELCIMYILPASHCSALTDMRRMFEKKMEKKNEEVK